MALSLVTAPTSEPVTLAQQKLHLRIDTSDDDTYINLCIKAARQWVEGQTHLAMMAQTWDYFIDGGWPTRNGLLWITLPLNPVPAQTSPSTVIITYVDSDGASQTLAQTQYTLVGRRYGSYIVPAYGVSWPTVRNVPNAITVRFLAGSNSSPVAFPQELHQAVMILAGHYYENRETAIDAPKAVEALISPFRASTF